MSVTNEHGADARNPQPLKTAKAGASSVVVMHKVEGWASPPSSVVVMHKVEGWASPLGSIQTQYTFEPFGNAPQSGAASTNSFAYTGRENDGTGFYYNRARYYNPALGRFISEDPIGLIGGIDQYSYVGDSPPNFTDPSGFSPMSDKGCRRRLCHKVYQTYVYGQFFGNTVLPTFSLLSYIPGSGHAADNWAELPLSIGKIVGVAYLSNLAWQNAMTGNSMVAIGNLTSGAPLSSYVAAEGESLLTTASLQQGVVTASEEIVAPIIAATIIASTIQDAYVWAHCWSQ